MQGTWPLKIAALFGTLTFLAMFCLPAPGAYLPKVDRMTTEKSATGTIDHASYQFDLTVTKLSVLQEFREATVAPLESFALHQMSFNETYMDRVLNVTRPRLVSEAFETNYLPVYEEAQTPDLHRLWRITSD